MFNDFAICFGVKLHVICDLGWIQLVIILIFIIIIIIFVIIICFD